MEKVISFIRAADTVPRETLQGWLISEEARSLVSSRLDASGLSVYLVKPLPEDFPYQPASDTTSTSIGAAPRYDAIVECWHLVGALPELTTRWRSLLGDLASDIHPYHVYEQHVMDRSLAGETRRRTLIGQLMFHADMPDSAARRSWKLHAGLVDKIHVGATRYVQNWVLKALDADCPRARGIPQLHFPTHEDLVKRFFDSPRGRDEILQDTAHFVQSGPRFYTVEDPLTI